VLRSSLLVVAVLIVSAGHAQQVSGDPRAPAPGAYSNRQLTVEDCNNTDPSSGDGCIENREQTAVDDSAVADYGPDYSDDAPAYDAAPPVYLGISLVPDGYWGWPYYGFGYGYGYGYCCGYGYGWPYYGFASFAFGWPYYGYAGYWGGGHWGGSWHGHGHHDGDHGDWGHHDGDHGHHGDYHGPYRDTGHGRYADQGAGSSSSGGHAGHGSAPAGAAMRTTTAANFARAGAAPASHGHFADTPAGSARTSAQTNQFPGANRIAGRTPLPSASYYAAARGAFGANSATSAYAGAATNNRTGAGYAYGRGNAVTSTRNANDAYRVTSMPSRGYAASANRGGPITRSSGNVAPQRYSGARMSYPQQFHAPSNRAYAHATMSPGSAARGPAYSGARGARPSYARGGSGAAPHGGHAGTAAAHSGSAGYSHSAHGH